MKRLPLSVFIIAKDEADRISAAINSVKDWVDEVIVIDSGSRDDTVRIAESLGARTLYNEWKGYGPQKRFGEDQCRNRWLLALDADEEVPAALAAEIHGLFAEGEPSHAAYILRIRDMFPGEMRLPPFAHTNYVIRLYDRSKARFSESPVHDSVIVQEGETRMLGAPLMHRSFRSMTHAVDKMNRYSAMQANYLLTSGMRFPMLRLVTEFPVMFFKAYCLRFYMLRGWRGFAYAIIYAFGRVVRIAKYLEMRTRN